MLIAFCCLLFFAYKVVLLWFDRNERNKKWWFGCFTAGLAFIGIGFGIYMDVVAQKALGLLIMPAGLTWVLLAGIATTLWILRHRRLAILTSMTWLLFTLAGNKYVGEALMVSLEKNIPPVDIQTIKPLQAIFVLGGGTALSSNGPAVGAAGDRLVLAARLFHAGKTPLLVCSGSGIEDLDQNRDLAEETATIWRGLGVPAANIFALPPGPTITKAEIMAYEKIIKENNWTDVGLVTSAWHMPRALKLCKKYNINPVPLGADRRGRFHKFSLYYLIPQQAGFRDVQLGLWEYLGMLVGR